MRIKKYVLLTLILTGWIIDMEACTIFSGKDKKDHVWAGNNEIINSVTSESIYLLGHETKISYLKNN